ncbi:hypothetical protein [Modicisalibacter sp. MOD 31.J]|uniref:hypothetical protein n=1 Tax=Modicisalibacter sp. MOD 31.J TaxID=2831897 RepID=UPI001CC9B3EE|nr:hypothetical protein [Modicisalibacter sp. MOD 31.J]MBZ9574588.1 hypothetical protein [Modicisalibacter sp. MOD 31.J]
MTCAVDAKALDRAESPESSADWLAQEMAEAGFVQCHACGWWYPPPKVAKVQGEPRCAECREAGA